MTAIGSATCPECGMPMGADFHDQRETVRCDFGDHCTGCQDDCDECNAQGGYVRCPSTS